MDDPGFAGAPETSDPSQASGQSHSPLDAAAQFLTFDPGMYAVDFHASRTATTNVGLTLPCARLDPMPPSAELEGRAFISLMSEGGWFCHGDLPAFIRVVGGKAAILLTIYKDAGGMPAPELRIRYIRDDLRFAPTANGAAAPDAADAAPDATSPGADLVASDRSLPIEVLAHAQERGDIRAGGGQWCGTPGSQRWVEGFGVTLGADAGIERAELEYQGILGQSWSTPWFAAGEFCGSRGMALPILGLRVRLTGRAAELHECVYYGSFIGVGEVGPCVDGAPCEGGGQPMDALRVVIRRRPADAAPRDAATPSRPRKRGGGKSNG